MEPLLGAGCAGAARNGRSESFLDEQQAALAAQQTDRRGLSQHADRTRLAVTTLTTARRIEGGFTPCSRAQASPPASALLLMTAATWAPKRSRQRPFWAAWTMAAMLEPLPEMRMTMFLFTTRCTDRFSARWGRQV